MQFLLALKQADIVKSLWFYVFISVPGETFRCTFFSCHDHADNVRSFLLLDLLTRKFGKYFLGDAEAYDVSLIVLFLLCLGTSAFVGNGCDLFTESQFEINRDVLLVWGFHCCRTMWTEDLLLAEATICTLRGRFILWTENCAALTSGFLPCIHIFRKSPIFSWWTRFRFGLQNPVQNVGINSHQRQFTVSNS